MDISKETVIGIVVGLIGAIGLLLINPEKPIWRVSLLVLMAVGLVYLAANLNWVTQRGIELSIINGAVLVKDKHSSILRLAFSSLVAVSFVVIFGIMSWPENVRQPQIPTTMIASSGSYAPAAANPKLPLPRPVDTTSPLIPTAVPPKPKPKPTVKPAQPAQTAPIPTRPNPLDPFDGAPNSKVADDAIAEAIRLQNSMKICQEEMAKAVKQDIDNHDPSGSMAKAYAWQTKNSLQGYANDFTNLHTSLIYRLGVAERNADGDYALKQLLDPDPNFFNCWYFKSVGDYFYSLGSKLKAKGDYVSHVYISGNSATELIVDKIERQ